MQSFLFAFFQAFSKHVKLYCQIEDGNISALIRISISSSKQM